jgi:putative transposase
MQGGSRPARGGWGLALHFTGCHFANGRADATVNAIERFHEEFGRRIKTQTVLPSAEPAMMLFSALLAGQITMRKVGGWQPDPESRQ